MGRASIRKAIQQYLTSQNIQFVGKVYQHPPKFTAEGEFVGTSFIGEGSGAVIYIHLAKQRGQQIRLIGGQPGGRQRTYTVGLVCVFRSKNSNTEEVGEENDVFLDSLVDAIENNGQPGNGAVFMWGYGDTVGDIDIDVKAEMPRPLRLQASQVFSVVEVTAIEMNV